MEHSHLVALHLLAVYAWSQRRRARISERRGVTCISNCECQIISLASFLSSLCHKCFERRSYSRTLHRVKHT